MFRIQRAVLLVSVSLVLLEHYVSSILTNVPKVNHCVKTVEYVLILSTVTNVVARPVSRGSTAR